MAKVKIDLNEKELENVRKDWEYMSKNEYSPYAILVIISEKYGCTCSIVYENGEPYIRIYRN